MILSICCIALLALVMKNPQTLFVYFVTQYYLTVCWHQESCKEMETMHSDNKNKYKSFYERKLESLNKTMSILAKKCRKENDNLTEASYHNSLYAEAHIIG